MTIEQIKAKIQYGDYNTLQKVLGAPTVASARMRFMRGDKEAIKGMEAILENRAQLIEKYQSKKVS